MIKYKHQLRKYNFIIRKERKNHHKKKEGSSNEILYNDSIITFDIETTSAWRLEDGSIIGYTPGRSAEWWNEQEPLSLCYVWKASKIFSMICRKKRKILYGCITSRMSLLSWDQSLHGRIRV